MEGLGELQLEELNDGLLEPPAEHKFEDWSMLEKKEFGLCPLWEEPISSFEESERAPIFALSSTPVTELGDGEDVTSECLDIKTSSASVSASVSASADESANVDVQPKTAEEMRAARWGAVLRLREKKKRRSFTKKILYHKRKVVADSRPRVMGRFVKKGVRVN